MITSIVLPERYKIGVDKFGKFNLDDIKLSIRDIPFVRYRFKEYSLDDVGYIKNMINTFSYSTHLMEVDMEGNFDSSIEQMVDAIENLVVFVYIDVDNEIVASENFREDQIENLHKLIKVMPYVERVMIRDKSTTMHKISGDKLKKILCNTLKIKDNMVGFCQSPLSMIEGQACLTAAKARELATNYNNNEDCPVPSANHERRTSYCDCCGCIKYEVVTHDIEVIVSDKPKSATKANKKVKASGENNVGVADKESEQKEKRVAKKIPKGAIRGFNMKL